MGRYIQTECTWSIEIYILLNNQCRDATWTARFESKRKMKTKRIARKIADAHRALSSTKKAVTDPGGFIAEKTWKRIDEYGRSPSRHGPVRNRTQCYNDRTKSFVKRDTQTGRFVGNKPRRPYKGVRLE